MIKEKHIRKLRITVLLLILIGATACNDNSYRGYEPPEEIESTDPVPVLLSLGSTNYSVTTKGSGAIEGGENDEVWNNSYVYIYSFLKDGGTDFTTPMETVINEENFKLPHCLIDGAHDGAGSQYGKKAKVSISNRAIEWVEEEKIYYPSSSEPYEFYGYYIDDIIPDGITRTSHTITLDVKIDGSQDIMSGIASLTEDQKNDLARNYLEAEQETIKKALYSSYTARRNFQPVMNFSHHLTRFKFQIYGSRPESENIYVESINMVSQSQAKFIVADKVYSNIGISFYGEKDKLDLKDPGGKPLASDHDYRPIYKEEEQSKDIFDRTPTLVGESLLLPPTDKYDMNMIICQEIENKFGGKDTVKLNSPNSISLGNGNIFEAGKEYTIRIAVFGIEDIEIMVTAEEWISGGNIDLNPEKDNF